jgi:hypothetical protein
MTRFMPKEMQIANFKRLFLIWNKQLEKENPDFIASDKIDEIDWDSFVTDGQTFSENLDDLKNNYPEYYWSYVERERKKEAESEERQLEAQNEEIRVEHEALFEAEQQGNLIAQEIEPEAELESPVGVWKVEKIALGEIRTIEVEIMPHSVKSKGKTYTFGRIQLSVSGDLLGYRAKISVFVPEIH